MPRATRSLLITLLVVSSVVTGTTGLAAAANAEGTITADPETAGELSTHTVELAVVGSAAGRLEGVRVDYDESGAEIDGVTSESVEVAGLDRGADGSGATIDRNIADDLDGVEVDGSTLLFEFGGAYRVEAGDEVVLVYGDVTNPGAGEHDVDMDFNPDARSGTTTTALHIGHGGPSAAVDFADQTADGANVTVDSVNLSAGGYVVVHASDNGTPGAVLGHSDYLDAGAHEDVVVTLDESLTEDRELIAMAHRDTNENELYEFPDADGPYTVDGSPVVDAATVSLPATPTATPTPTATEMGTDTPASTTTGTAMATDTRTTSPTPTEGSAPGFSAVLAVVAVLALAALATRR